MSLILQMIARNVPLFTWQRFADENRSVGYFTYNLTKNLDRIAQTMVAGLSHEEVIELVYREFEIIPSTVRTAFTDLANERYKNPSSNNQRKGIKKLDDRLGGRILSVAGGPTTRELKTVGGNLVSIQRRVKPNVAGAQQAFGGYSKPKDFDSWSPGRKRRFHKEMAAQRRG